MKVSAVIVTYNRLELLKKCLSAISSQSHAVEHVIVIDNNSAQETFDYLRNLDGIDYIRLESNIGGAGGFFNGLKYFIENTSDDFVWVMDDDTIPEKDALKKLLSVFEKNKNVGFLASNVRWIDESPAVMNIPHVVVNDWNELIDKQNIVKIHRATFVSVIFSRNVVLKVGLPIKEFFIWGDDTEYTERISRKYPSYFVAASIVHHEMKSNTGVNIVNDNSDRLDRYFYAYRNRMYNYRKLGGKEFGKYCLQIIVEFGSVLFKGKHKFKKIFLIIKGTVYGLFFNPKIVFIKDDIEKK